MGLLGGTESVGQLVSRASLILGFNRELRSGAEKMGLTAFAQGVVASTLWAKVTSSGQSPLLLVRSTKKPRMPTAVGPSRSQRWESPTIHDAVGDAPS